MKMNVWMSCLTLFLFFGCSQSASETNRSFYAPIKHTLGEFKLTLAWGISALIGFIAFILPFGIVAWLGRMGWRRFKGRQ